MFMAVKQIFQYIVFFLVQFATQPDFGYKAIGIWTAFNS